MYIVIKQIVSITEYMSCSCLKLVIVRRVCESVHNKGSGLQFNKL